MYTLLKKICILIIGFSMINGENQVCQAPSALEFNRMKAQVLDSQWSWLGEGYETDETVIGDTHCPVLSNLLIESSDAPLCPSFKVEEYDPLRIPSTITQQKCRCARCLSPGSKRLERSMCKPVYRLLPVLRKSKCQEGTEHYSTVLERVSVGCQCRVRGMYSPTPKLA